MKTAMIPIVMALILVLAACGGGVDEVASGTVVGKIEESDLGSGKSASATLDLSPGRYVLICNVSGHYKDGMYAGFEVTDGDAPKSATVEVKLGEWFARAERASVATGSITFKVTNRGSSDHNFLVIKTDLAPAALVVK